MYTCAAKADASKRIASSMSTATSSFDNSVRILCPALALRTMGLVTVGGIDVLNAPRVHINTSECGISGGIFISRRSIPVVGP